jgi:hypothetical protein
MPVKTGSESKDEVIWDNFSDRLCNYLETVTLGSLIEDSNSDIIDSRPKLNDEEPMVQDKSWNIA